MATVVIGSKSWGNITQINGTSEQGWKITSNGNCYVNITAPCGGSAKIFCGSTAKLGGVVVTYHGLYKYGCGGGPVYGSSAKSAEGPSTKGCATMTYHKINIPAGSCKIYGTVPDPPVIPPPPPPTPPMNLTVKVGPCFDYFRADNKQWDDKYIFSGEDFFGKPKT